MTEISSSLLPFCSPNRACLHSSFHAPLLSPLRSPFRSCRLSTDAVDFSLFLTLPLEILDLVVERLNPESFSNWRACSRTMKDIADSCRPQFLRYEWSRINHYTQTTLAIATELFNSRLPPVFEEHVCFLVQTLHELDDHVRARLACQPIHSDSFAELSHAFCAQIQSAASICTDILHHRKHFTVNFEMLDMSLRRGFKELMAMFPLTSLSAPPPPLRREPSPVIFRPISPYEMQQNRVYSRSQSQPTIVPLARSAYNCTKNVSIASDSSPSSSPDPPVPRRPSSRSSSRRADPELSPTTIIQTPTVLIRDSRARAAWEKHFGQVAIVDFNLFFQQLVVGEWPAAASHHDFYTFFNFFLNFPRDNFMTTYKWDMITKQFGPYSLFFDNFVQFGCGNGFIGLVNSVKADEVLNKKPGSYVFRFSRKEPEKLTLSYCTSSSGLPQVFHRRKPHEISLQKFLESILQSRSHVLFQPATCRLSHAGAQISSLEEFVCSCEYFLAQSESPDQTESDSQIFQTKVALCERCDKHCSADDPSLLSESIAYL
ncbi:MAG: hypothetical protein Q8P67_19410 [archaeon]|nr:hypothetical protein [archaeon]